MSSPACSPGLDCSVLNSCPVYSLPCPIGYFCSSYAGFPKEDELDYQYAMLKWQYADTEVTRSNAASFADPDRAIQMRCLPGFYCPSNQEMISCPKGHWCAESFVTPIKCGLLSYCPENSTYEANFVDLILSIIFSTILLILSWRAVRSQQIKESICRNRFGGKDAKDMERESLLQSGKARKVSSVGIELENLHYGVSGRSELILSNISASIPPGKLTLLLGPTGCGKTSILNVIRDGGKHLSRGRVDFRVVDVETSSASHVLTTGTAVTEASSPADQRNPVITGLDTVFEEATNPLLRESAQSSLRPSEVPFVISNLSSFIGFVPQEDILDRKLTVREQLLFHVQTRSKYPLPVAAANEAVERTLNDLGIAHVADAIIGGGENAAANISGGQLKRVNIACELVAIASPGVLLLDEPTSGLDAAIAFDLMECIAALTRTKGVTVFCVLQQPRDEIFQRVDHLLLMRVGGRLVYEGDVQHVTEFLTTKLGRQPCSVETSDADFCIDVLNEMSGDSSLSHSSPRKRQQQSTSKGGGDYIALEQGEEMDWEDSAVVPPKSKNWWKDLRQQGKDAYNLITHERFYRQIKLQMWRLSTVRLRSRVQLIVYMCINVIMAVSLSSGFSVYVGTTYSSVFAPPARDEVKAFYPSPFQKYENVNVNQLPLNQLMFLMGGALGCASSLAAVPVFVGMRDVACRELRSGISIETFGLGRMLADLPFFFVQAMVFCGTWTAFGMAGSPGDWMAVVVGTAFATSGLGYLVTTVVEPRSASVVAIIATFMCCVFSGTDPTLRQVSTTPFIYWPWYLSFATWTSEASYVTWSKYLSDKDNVPQPVQEGADFYGYDVSHGVTRSVLALFALGLGLRFLTIVYLQTYKR